MTSPAPQEPTAHARVQAVVHGRVQGVGFRYHTQALALDLGLRGYVRNRWDGAVEVVVEGSQTALDRLVAWLSHGPRMAHVTRVEVQPQPPTESFDTFEVRY